MLAPKTDLNAKYLVVGTHHFPQDMILSTPPYLPTRNASKIQVWLDSLLLR